MMLLVIMQIYVQCVQQHACVCVCENITFGVLQDRKKKNLLFVAQ